jgi:putative ABC transport system permease protein
MWASIRAFLYRLINITRRHRSNGSLDSEIEFHLDMEIKENLRQGMSLEEARRRALIALGGIDQTKEIYRETGTIRWLGAIARDVRYGSRMFGKNPTLSAAALVTLTLCIGANTAIFSMLYALIIKPLPFREPSRIVEISNSWPKQKLDRWPSSIVQYLDFRDHTDAFTHLGLWEPWECTLGEQDGAARSNGALATADMFGVFDLKPILGRFFTLENSVPANDRVLVLTQSFWESHFQKNPGILGQSMRIDGVSYQIVGVAPRTLEAFDARVKFVVPLSWPPDQVKTMFRYNMLPRLYGRLKPAATISGSYCQIAALEQRFYESAPPPTRDALDRSGHRISIDTIHSQRTEPVKLRIYLLEGGVLFVLLIGCGNIANLLLAHSNARRSELAIRIALGAERGAIVRQLLVESLILTWLGAVLGLALSWGALKAVNKFTAQLLPNTLPFVIDSRILGFTAFLAIMTALLIGLFPVLHVLGGNLLTVIPNQSRSISKSRSIRSMSGSLIVVQMAVTLMLLAGAGLLIRSFANVLRIDPGFNPRQLVTARVGTPPDYRRDNRGRQFPQELLDKLREIPGVKSISLATDTPYQARPYFSYPVLIRNYKAPTGEPSSASYNLGATASYLDAMQIPLIEGRWFNEADIKDVRNKFVVDKDFARRYFPGGSAVGRQIAIGSEPEKPEGWGDIIGVVGKVRYLGVEEETGMPFIYYPLKEVQMDGVSIFLRGDRPVSDLLAQVREKVKALDPGLAVFREGPMESFSSPSFNERQAIMLLLCGFAGIALFLSAVGVYGVLACDVSQRTREIGIRSAMGATRKQITELILRQGLWKAGVGLALGIAGALLLSHFIASLLFDLKPTDPLSYGVVSMLLLVVAWLASYLPARRAARIDPIVALRSE